jgi:hypothetical protein
MRIILCLLLVAFNSGSHAANDYWVKSDRQNRHTCPSEQCGIIGQLFFREKAAVYEMKGSWGRITGVYDASCEGGRSEFVDSGNATCTPDNGITDGKFAEWALMSSLDSVHPPDPAEKASGVAKLIGGSDDFQLHEAVFVKAAIELLEQGACTVDDFTEFGGWLKSTTTYKDAPVYFFAYCGGYTVQNRIYLDASSGRIFR